MLRLNYLPEVWQPDEATSLLREWTGRRSRLVRQRTSIVNRLRSTLAQRLLDCPYDLTAGTGRQWLAAVTVDSDTRWLIGACRRTEAHSGAATGIVCSQSASGTADPSQTA